MSIPPVAEAVCLGGLLGSRVVVTMMLAGVMLPVVLAMMSAVMMLLVHHVLGSLGGIGRAGADDRHREGKRHGEAEGRQKGLSHGRVPMFLVERASTGRVSVGNRSPPAGITLAHGPDRGGA